MTIDSSSLFNDPPITATRVYAGEVRITDDLIFWNKITGVIKAQIHADDGNLHLEVAGDEKLQIKTDGEFLMDGYIKSANASFSIATDELVFRDSALNQLGYIDSQGVLHGIQVDLGGQLPVIDINNGTTGSLLASRIVDLDASKIATGTINNDRLPTTPTFNGVNFNTLSSGDWAKLYTEGTADDEDYENNGHRLVLELGDDQDDPAEFIIRRYSDSELLFKVEGDGRVSASASLNAPTLNGTIGNVPTLNSTTINVDNIASKTGSTINIDTGDWLVVDKIKAHTNQLNFNGDTHSFKSTGGTSTYATLNSSGYISTGKVEAAYFKSGYNELRINQYVPIWEMNTGLGVIGDILTQSIGSFGPLANLPYQAPVHEFKDHSGTIPYGTITTNGFVGNGSLLTGLNATNIASGTIDNLRLPSTISVSTLIGDGSGITGFTASQIPNLDGSKITTGILTRPLTTTGKVEADSFRLTGSSYDILWNGSRIQSLDYWKIGGAEFSPPAGSTAIPISAIPADSTDVMLLYESGGAPVFRVAETYTRCYETFMARKELYAGLAIVPSTANYVDLEFVDRFGVGEQLNTNKPVVRFHDTGVVAFFGSGNGSCSIEIDGNISLTDFSKEIRAERINFNNRGSITWTFYSSSKLYQGAGHFYWRKQDNTETPVMYLNTTTGNLGIGGTTTPQSTLEVSGTFDFNTGSNRIHGKDGGRIRHYTEYHLFYNYAGVERMRINNNGNVGIGTTAPQKLLHIEGNSNHLRLSYTGYPTTFFWDINRNIDGGKLFFASENGVKMVLTTGGYLGVGKTAPAYNIDVAGGINASTLRVDGGANNLWQPGTIYTDNSWGMIFRGHGTESFAEFGWFTSGGAQRMIMVNGNLGVGISSINPPYARLEVGAGVYSTTYAQTRYFRYDGSPAEWLSSNVSDFFGMVSIFANDDIVSKQHIVSHAGTMTASDERIKENIQDISDTEALDTLRLLKPKTYTYIDKHRKGTEKVIGFIAQEVQEVLPLATGKRYDTIPNIYELAKVSESNVITFTNFNTSNLTVNTMIDAKSEKSGDIRLTIEEVIDDHSIKVKEDIDGEQVFVMGEYVDDFTFLKKDYIWTVAAAALQEVDRQQQADKERIATLEAQVNNLIQIVNELRDSGTAP